MTQVEKIKFLFDVIEEKDIPRPIFDSLIQLDQTSFYYDGDKSFGEGLPTLQYLDKYNCYLIFQWFLKAKSRVENKEVLAEDNLPLNIEGLISLMEFFGLGFHIGYNELKSEVENTKSDFGNAEKVRTSMIYNVVNTFVIKSGFGSELHVNKEFVFKYTKKSMQEDGYKFGRTYFAWLSILQNIPHFLEYFEKDSKTKNPKELKNEKEHTWFKIGLDFATGKIFEIYKQDKTIPFRDLAEKIGFKRSDHSYFSNTINGNPSAKNIFGSRKKMNLLEAHCSKYKIDTCIEFNEAMGLINAE